MIHQLLLALAYLHEKGITHRDLKTENLVFERHKDGQFFIRVIDFGFALDLNDPAIKDDSALIFMGTPYYMSPEVVQEEVLTVQSDLWSVGVILYTMLCGYPPFAAARDKEDLFRLICSCDFECGGPAWEQVSAEAINFIDRLINPVLEQRMTAKEALNHPWITGNVQAAQPSQYLLEDLSKVKHKSDF